MVKERSVSGDLRMSSIVSSRLLLIMLIIKFIAITFFTVIFTVCDLVLHVVHKKSRSNVMTSSRYIMNKTPRTRARRGGIFESVVNFFERLKLDAVISLWQPGGQQTKTKFGMLDKSGKAQKCQSG